MDPGVRPDRAPGYFRLRTRELSVPEGQEVSHVGVDRPFTFTSLNQTRGSSVSCFCVIFLFHTSYYTNENPYFYKCYVTSVVQDEKENVPERLDRRLPRLILRLGPTENVIVFLFQVEVFLYITFTCIHLCMYAYSCTHVFGKRDPLWVRPVVILQNE